MLRAISAILHCNCLPDFNKQADENIHTLSYKLTTEQPLPTRPPSTNQQEEEEEEEQAKGQAQKQEQEPTLKAVVLSPPTEDDPDSTLTVIEASIEPNEDVGQDPIDEEPAKAEIAWKRTSAPPNLELNIPREPLPDFSLNSRSRLSYWGPPPYLAPDQPLPDPPTHLRQPCEPLTNQYSLYGAYFRGEETLPRVLLSMRLNPRLATVIRRT